jgi:F-type H+-transporting ATPase subunit gamma
MAKGLREISSRIKSIKSTAQITKAMQLVASSKMRKAQATALNGRDYTRLLAETLESALANLPPGFEQSLDAGGDTARARALLAPREIRTRGFLLVTTDKGLCGALNANVLRLAAAQPPGARFVLIGRKGAQYAGRNGLEVLGKPYWVSDHAAFAETRHPAEFIINQYATGEIDSVEIIYPRFKNTLVQEAEIDRLLPIENIRALAKSTRGGEHSQGMCFEPSASEILRELPELLIRNAIYHAVLEAKAAEHSARMVAMKAATDNAHKIIENLTLEFNKARQAAITQEINEISAAVLSER